MNLFKDLSLHDLMQNESLETHSILYIGRTISDGLSEGFFFPIPANFKNGGCFKTKDGVKLTATERSELFRLMGEQGNFRRSINEIMRDAGDWNSIVRMRNLRRQGKTSEEVSLKQWDHLHIRLNLARRQAEAIAYQEMDADMFAAIEARQIQQERRQQASGEGTVLDESLNIRN